MPSLVPMKIFNKYTIESLKLFIIFDQLFGLLNWNSTVFLLQNKSFFFSSFGSWSDWKSNEIFLSTVMYNFGHSSDSKYRSLMWGRYLRITAWFLNARWWHACQVVSDVICSKFIESNLCLCYCLLLSTQSY